MRRTSLLAATAAMSICVALVSTASASENVRLSTRLVSGGTAVATARWTNAQRLVTNRWAGYETTVGTVSSVRGTWAVPRLSCASVDTRSSTWIGVGGWAGGSLLQVGMYDDCLGGVPVQGAFAEQYPGSTISFALLIRTGDVVTATIAKDRRGWFARLTDRTTRQSETARAPDYRGGSSVEWMAEAYGLSAGEQMANFGSERLRAFSINGAPSRTSALAVFETPKVVATNPRSGVLQLTYR
jgi:hypothetical protein